MILELLCSIFTDEMLDQKFHLASPFHRETIEELHRGEYDLNGLRLTLDILDTSGSHCFPAMRKLAIDTGDAFVLVYSVESETSFQVRHDTGQLCTCVP